MSLEHPPTKQIANHAADNDASSDAASQAQYRAAERIVHRKLRFYSHLLVYIVICCMLLAINLMTSPAYIWAKWPLLAWGIAIILHGVQVFASDATAQIKRSMIEKELQKQRQKK